MLSDEVVEEQFVCDLSKCKGGCCEDGDAGAPLTKEEMKIIDGIYDTVKPYLTIEGIQEIEKRGLYTFDREFGWVTPTIEGKLCSYGFRDQNGIIKCGFEQAFYDGKISWKKPISCHLYPIKISKSKENELVNYEPRETLCSAALYLPILKLILRRCSLSAALMVLFAIKEAAWLLIVYVEMLGE